MFSSKQGLVRKEGTPKKIFKGMALHFILYPASYSLIFEIENQEAYTTDECYEIGKRGYKQI